MGDHPDDDRDPRGPATPEEIERVEAGRRANWDLLYDLLAGGPRPTSDDWRVRGRSKAYWAFVVLVLVGCVVLALVRDQ